MSACDVYPSLGLQFIETLFIQRDKTHTKDNKMGIYTLKTLKNLFSQYYFSRYLYWLLSVLKGGLLLSPGMVSWHIEQISLLGLR